MRRHGGHLQAKERGLRRRQTCQRLDLGLDLKYPHEVTENRIGRRCTLSIRPWGNKLLTLWCLLWEPKLTDAPAVGSGQSGPLWGAGRAAARERESRFWMRGIHRMAAGGSGGGDKVRRRGRQSSHGACCLMLLLRPAPSAYANPLLPFSRQTRGPSAISSDFCSANYHHCPVLSLEVSPARSLGSSPSASFTPVL